ncbi:diguanylate cyclase (GGDEF) domain-containing protein [Desulfuromusa kysingii]|uniref:diguanylate cyclase n=1 Tax=Desulfuromusa kysingii TaxID=37625 RepID=A0A1H4AVN1_9BACT|nr:GGDEF domain-containing protein [Desulfuromusa kysingii]SEA39911.1 diguanylate cyclase (GGDEF) domain-containing protein [Desulfuromusa kysingii]
MTVNSDDSHAPASSTLTCPVGVTDCPIALEVAELRRNLSTLSDLVKTDPLTGIGNYRSFIQALEQEIERTLRSGQPTSLVMLDIDFFKKVNDQWGHEVGNQALIHLTTLLQKTVRKLDIPCRYGGEEFAIILPDTTLTASIPVAERIRQVIENTPLDVAGKSLKLTVSLGIATYREQENISVAELVKQADEYLYQAKENGRNCVCHAKPPSINIVSKEEKQTLSELFGSGMTKKD